MKDIWSQKSHLGLWQFQEFNIIMFLKSGRFKLNIRPKKKITTQASQNGAKQDNGAAGGYSVSASLGGRAKDKILIMDDQALSRSVPSSSFSASNRTRSQGND